MMMKNQNIATILMLLSFLISGCQKDEYTLGTLIVPNNVQLSYEIVGADAENPYGDGSGLVNFIATADNEITYNYIFGDGKNNEIAPSGRVSHQFSKTGVNKYNVTVNAVGTGGMTSGKTIQIEVYSSFTDDEALEFLSGGSTRSWYWAADQRGHLGLGPNDRVYDNGEHTYAYWYEAVPFEKSASSLYDCEFVFTKTDGNLTFEHKNPTGEAFIQGIYAEALGLGEEGSHPFEIGGIKNVSFGPSSSLATVDGAYRGTTLSISDGGFMGFYAGSSDYEIIQITDNLLKVRVVQTNNPEFAWYHIFTTVKPVQEGK